MFVLAGTDPRYSALFSGDYSLYGDKLFVARAAHLDDGVCFVGCYTLQGGHVWSYEFVFPTNYREVKLVATTDGGAAVLLIGYTPYVYVTKISGTGAILWTRKIPGVFMGDQCNLAQGPNGDVWAWSILYGYAGGSQVHRLDGATGASVLKLKGRIQSGYELPYGTFADQSHLIAPLADGGYFFGGFLVSSTGVHTHYLSSGIDSRLHHPRYLQPNNNVVLLSGTTLVSLNATAQTVNYAHAYTDSVLYIAADGSGNYKAVFDLWADDGGLSVIRPSAYSAAGYGIATFDPAPYNAFDPVSNVTPHPTQDTCVFTDSYEDWHTPVLCWVSEGTLAGTGRHGLSRSLDEPDYKISDAFVRTSVTESCAPTSVQHTVSWSAVNQAPALITTADVWESIPFSVPAPDLFARKEVSLGSFFQSFVNAAES